MAENVVGSQSNAPGAPAMGDHTCKPSRVVAWLRYLETASKDREARAALERVLGYANNTVGAFRRAIENGEHLKVPRTI